MTINLYIDHKSLHCKPCGLVANPHLGATPDGILTWYLTTGNIKCPYGGRNSHPDVLRNDHNSLLNSNPCSQVLHTNAGPAFTV